MLRQAVATVSQGLRSYPKQITEMGGSRFDLMSMFGYSDSGAYVDRDTALRVSAVYACVNLISRTIGALPLHVYARQGDDGRKIMRTEGTKYLWWRPNPEVARSIFWETCIGHAVLSGNSYIYVVTENRRPVELWPIDPARVAVGRASDGQKVYTIDGTQAQKDFVNGGNIVHVQAWGTDGLKGLSPIALSRQAIGLALSAEKAAAKITGTGGQPSGILSTDQDLKQDQADALAAKFEETHGGSENAGKVLVVGKGMKWSPTTINPDDLQSLESRRYQVVDIARDYLVPPEMIGASIEGSSSLTYANAEDRMLHFVTLTLQPWITRFEQTISDELLAPQNQYVKFDMRGLLRGNSTQRIAFYTGMAELGAITEDEIRGFEDLEPIPEGAKRPTKAAAPVAEPPRALETTVNIDMPPMDVRLQPTFIHEYPELPPPEQPRKVTKRITRDENGAIATIEEE